MRGEDNCLCLAQQPEGKEHGIDVQNSMSSSSAFTGLKIEKLFDLDSLVKPV